MDNRQWAVILGCSSGVGRAIAQQACNTLGLNIFGAHRNHWPEQADELQQYLRGQDRRAEFYVGDVGTAQGVEAAGQALAEVAPPGSVRLFVHSIANASLGRYMPGGEGVHRQLIPKNFHKTMDAMANSFPWWAQTLEQHKLLAPGARLLGLTNPIGDSLLVNFGLINAAKAALEMYIKHLALEMGPMGYRVNLLNFGTVETLAASMGFGPRWEPFKELCATAIGAGRIVTSDEVAKLVMLLCDERADWFNGATIDFTAGQARNMLEAHLRLEEGSK